MHEGQDFEAFIHRAEAAGEKRDRMGLLHEVEFAGEEVVEVDELRVAVDDFVRALLEGQADVQTEAVFAAGAALRRAHDAIAAAGDHHVSVLAHLAREFLGGEELGRVRRRAALPKTQTFRVAR